MKASKLVAQWRDAIMGGYGIHEVDRWITENTFIGGLNFSYEGHEYQQRILQSTSPVVVVKKCAQVGISELAIRRALALMDIIPTFNTIYTMPTASFAQDFMKTRVDDIIRTSPRLSSQVSSDLNNTSIKKIGESLLYLKGTIGDKSAISIPADMVTVDELDFSDQNNVEILASRMSHSPFRWWFYLSTPTTPNFGIDGKFQNSMRHFNLCKCNHCNHWFEPDYLKHVVVPEYNGGLLEVTASMLGKIKWREAVLLCPECGKEPSLMPEHRQWVCENPLDDLPSEGFQVNPFDNPTLLTPSYLLEVSTRFQRKVNFVNYHLGQTMTDDDSGLTRIDIQTMIENGAKSTTRGERVIGIDLGTNCHIMVAVVGGNGDITVIETHKVRHTSLREYVEGLRRKHRPIAIVSDAMPYTETIYTMQQTMTELFGAFYVNLKGMREYSIRDEEEDKGKAALDVRQLSVNRDYALDVLLADIRGNRVNVLPSVEHIDDIYVHLLDMQRKEKVSKVNIGAVTSGVEEFTWVKDKGEDHFHHAMLYTRIASKLAFRNDKRTSIPIMQTTPKQRTLARRRGELW